MLGVLGLPERVTHRVRLDLGLGTTGKRLAQQALVAVPSLVVPSAFLVLVNRLAVASYPVIIGWAITVGLAGQDYRRFGIALAVLTAAYLVALVSYRLGYRLHILAMQFVCYELRMRVARTVLNRRRKVELTPGRSLSVFVVDVNRVGWMTELAAEMPANLLVIAAIGIYLTTLWWPLGLIVLIAAPILVFGIDAIAGPLRRRVREQQTRVADVSGQAADILTGLRVIKGLHAEQVAGERFSKTSQVALDAAMRARHSQARLLGMTSLGLGVFLAAIVVLVAWLGLTHRLGLGELITVAGLAQAVTTPMTALVRQMGTMWPSGVGSADRVISLLHSPTAGHGGTAHLDTASPALQVTGLRTAHIDHLDLDIPPGHTVGLVTDSVTAAELCDVLAGRSDPLAGSVKLGGVDLADLDPDVAAESLIVAPHAAQLFAGSIADNVAPSEIGTVDTAQAMFAASCEDILDRSSAGEDAWVGDQGSSLSGGQRQRVALARAYAAGPPQLVLNEPTSAVDSVTTTQIAQRFAAVRGTGGTMLITTSPALLGVADEVVWISDGKIRALGRHEDLLSDSAYRSML